MPFRLSCRMPWHAFRAAGWLVLTTGSLAGCSEPVRVTAPSVPAPIAATIEPESSPVVPVVRYSRYTLMELVPGDDQRDLMHQVIDITIPAAADTNVGDALHYVLRRSGYRLCDTRAYTTAVLYALPLPAAHEHLGPITLRDALQLLAGPRWTLQVHDETREVCFVPLPDDRPASSASPPSSLDEPAPSMDADPINDPVGGSK